MDKPQLQYFTKQLMHWHNVDNKRSMPWKEEKDPYKIWLSEIILQQTRTEQGLPYYNRFVQHYPTIADLAQANDEEVFRLWQGLGYYNRCRNMLATARYIHEDCDDIFPNTYTDILQLKGVGPYTAAAIASFAYNLPHAVVDGNVYRLLSRYFGIETPIDSTDGKHQFKNLADDLLDVTNSAAYNQAIMDFGATVCKPAAPNCDSCPFQKKCFAYQKGLITDLPIKSKKLKLQTRHFHYLVLQYNNSIWIRKRTEKDIWQNLHEPYLVETEKTLSIKKLLQQNNVKKLNIQEQDILGSYSFTQRLTHRIIQSHFFIVTINKKPKNLPKDGFWVTVNDLSKYAFPKSIISFLEKKSYF